MNIRLATRAIFFSVHSIVFLLPYSPVLPIHPNPNPSHPFGDINNTDPINSIPAIIIITIKAMRIFFYS